MDASLKAFVKLASQKNFLAYSNEHDYMLNLSGDYDYLVKSYFNSQELELAGIDVHPTCKEMLDAYVSAILLEKAGQCGIPVPSYYISNGFFEPPVIIDPINPFMIKSRIIISSNNLEKITKSMTRNHTYPILCQELPAGSKVKKFRMVLSWSVTKKYRELATTIWDIFKIPLARVRIIELETGEILLSDISKLPLNELNAREVHYLSGRIRWER